MAEKTELQSSLSQNQKLVSQRTGECVMFVVMSRSGDVVCVFDTYSAAVSAPLSDAEKSCADCNSCSSVVSISSRRP